MLGERQGGGDVLGPKPFIVIEQLLNRRSLRQSLQDKLDGNPGALEYGLPKHHPRIKLDVFLPRI